MFLSLSASSDVAPSSTDVNIISGKDGKIIRVINGWVVAAGTATNIIFNSKGTGAGTPITSTIFAGINGGLLMPTPSQDRSGEPPFGYFQTNKGEGLTVTTGGGASVGVTVTYVTIG